MIPHLATEPRLGVSSLIRFAHKWLLPGLARRKATWLRLSSSGRKQNCLLSSRTQKILDFLAAEPGLEPR